MSAGWLLPDGDRLLHAEIAGWDHTRMHLAAPAGGPLVDNRSAHARGQLPAERRRRYPMLSLHHSQVDRLATYGSTLGGDDRRGYLLEIGPLEVWGRPRRVKDGARPRDERAAAAGADRSGNVPSVRRDEPDVAQGHAHLLRAHAVGLRSRLEPSNRVSR